MPAAMAKPRASRKDSARVRGEAFPFVAIADSAAAGRLPNLDFSLRPADQAMEYLRIAQKKLRGRQAKISTVHAELRISRSRYRDLFEGAPVGYVIANFGGTLLEVNFAAARLLGSDRLMMCGRRLDYYVSRADRARLNLRLRQARKAGIRRSFEVQMRRPSGQEFPVQLTVFCSRGATGEFRIVIMDLSEIKSIQEDLQAAQALLEKSIKERTRELLAANRQLSDEIKHRSQLEGALLEISERERRRFGQDLHDDTCQSLMGAAMELAVLYQRLHRSGVEIAPQFQHLAVHLNDIVNHTRRIAHGLHPVSLNEGLFPALQNLAETTAGKMQCRLVGKSPGRLAAHAELALYRIAQEALNNAARHSRATRVVIRLRKTASHLQLTVEDNGIGLPAPPARSSGMGMDILGYRARSIGAELRVESLPKGGVRVICKMPLEGVQAEDEKPPAALPNRRGARQSG
jgi:PAS domain S-box-containing protein